MNITNFTLPQTKLCTVVWFRNNQRNEVLIPTPANNKMLVNTMLTHRVGASEIRAVKSVDPKGLLRVGV